MFLVLLLLSTLLYLNRAQSNHAAGYLKAQSEHQEKVWQSILLKKQSGMQAYFDAYIMTQGVLEILESISFDDQQTREDARTRLFQLLNPLYQDLLSKRNIQQLHFHTPEGKSFLRFHYPEKHSDPLKHIRPTIRIANTELKFSAGFETGRVVSGFRNVFPIIHNGVHMGSVELSQPIEAFRSAMARMNPDREYTFIINASSVESKLFDEQRYLYEPSPVHPDWYFEDPHRVLPHAPPPLSDNAHDLLHLLSTKETAQHILENGISESVSLRLYGHPYSATFTPVRDTQEKATAFLISFAPADELKVAQQHFWAVGIISSLLFLLLFWAFFRILKDKESLGDEQKKLIAITETMGEGLYVMDKQGRITFANSAAGRMLGYQPEEMIGQVGHDLFHHHNEDNYIPIDDCPLFQAVINGKNYSNEEYFRRKNGTLFPIDITSTPLVNGSQIVGVVSVFSDITQKKENERKIQENELFLNSIFESIQDGISVLEPDLTIRHVNRFMEKWYVDNLPLVGEKCYEAFHNRAGHCEPCPSLRCINSMKVEREQVQGLPGTGKWFEVFSYPMMDCSTGKVSGIIEFVRDITKQKNAQDALEQSEKLLSTILEEAPINIWLVDLDQKPLIVNKAFRENTGFSTQNPSITQDELVKCLETDQKALESDGPVYFDEEVTFTDGCKHLLKTMKIRLSKPDGSIIGVLGIGLDVTEAKKYEHELTKAWQAAREASKAKSDFLANMSHEIRTPMTGIMGALKMLASKKFDNSTLQLINMTMESAQSLGSIIDDILDLSKVEAGKLLLDKKQFSIVDVVERVINLYAIPVQEKNLSLSCELPPDLPEVVVGDPLRLEQILRNLVSNAVKFTNSGSITVRANIVVRSHDQIQILFEVQDTGAGISKAFLPRVFDGFAQSESTYSRQVKGTGLGLSICKKFIDLMGGEISVSSRLGKGSTFQFSLPFKLPDKDMILDRPEPSLEKGSVSLSKSLKVLVAEDVPLNQKYIKFILESAGHKSVFVHNGEEAVKAFKNDRFDVILMDIQMPGMDGIQATRKIRELEKQESRAIDSSKEVERSVSESKESAGSESLKPGKSQTPIIALTAYVMAEQKADILASGMDGFVSKPINPDILFQEIELVLKGRVKSGFEEDNTQEDVDLDQDDVIIDHDCVESRYMGDTELWETLFSGFVTDELPNYVQGFQKSMKNNDLKDIQRQAHKLKSAMGTICAASGLKAASNLEQAANAEMDVSNTLEAVLQELELLKNYHESYFSSES